LSAELLPRPEWDVYLTGYRDGYRDGIDLGRRQMDDELATLQRSAHKVVQAMAKLDTYDDRERRRRERADDAAQRMVRAAEPWAREAS